MFYWHACKPNALGLIGRLLLVGLFDTGCVTRCIPVRYVAPSSDLCRDAELNEASLKWAHLTRILLFE